MKSLKNNQKLGATLAVVGILVGFLAMILIAKIYMPVVEGKILEGRPDEAITVRIVYALMGWIGMAGPWIPDAITFVMILLTGAPLSPILYFIIGFAFFPPLVLCWLIVFKEFVFVFVKALF